MNESQNELHEVKERGPKRVNLNIFWFLIILLSTIILTAIITALSLDGRTERAVNVGTDTRQEFAKLYNVYDTITKEYYTDVDKEALIEKSIKGMVEGLDDPYSEYMSIDETAKFEESITGEFEGIGTEIMQENNVIVVSSPIKGSPAEAAGIQTGDKIVKVNGKSIEGVSTSEAAAMIRGKKGTEVTLTIIRGSDKPFDIMIKRDKIHIDSVTYENKDDIGHVSINRFQEGTTDELQKFLDKAAEEDVKDIIIDFRNNPGGLLNEALAMINQFVPKGETLLYLEYAGKTREVVKAQRELNPSTKKFDNIYILVNEGSASASEVFTGALMDLTDAEVVGNKTFGKGIVQTTSEFKDGSLVKYTNSKWLTPNETWVHGKGIEPDFVINTPDYTRVKYLDSSEVYVLGQENDDILSIKVALDALGYDVDKFNNTFDENLEFEVMKYQNKNKIDASGFVTGETTEQLMIDLRKHIKENDTQLNQLIDYIKGDKTKEEITKEMKENSKHIPVNNNRSLDENESEE
ncbi:S41 family peptidase [Phocicoccus pinnipedialis]|uniref:Putative CtpA-like serine protease n=1 Tax=Phocicoccus pinnipedialis TaxID=110845 RepID=A0A6V7RD60_9BACL|nr:S41 family peptidase [Jeotgalicoccus pinnipedialis]MBP1939408.1 carboxyl-terminal processing protease [Jeotgalicoccus pinnipedialis]CAD2075495.1 putative CtpA-like serine protease [Jeotgalicoccus pinnipedialis]